MNSLAQSLSQSHSFATGIPWSRNGCSPVSFNKFTSHFSKGIWLNGQFPPRAPTLYPLGLIDSRFPKAVHGSLESLASFWLSFNGYQIRGLESIMNQLTPAIPDVVLAIPADKVGFTSFMEDGV